MARCNPRRSCSFSCALDHRSLLLSAIKSVTNTKITSPLAIAAKELAFEILDKAESDGTFASTSLKSFSLQLMSHLLPFTSKSCIDKEMKLDGYHEYRTSTSFHQLWVDFIQKTTSKVPHPTFYQHVTQHVFNSLIKLKYPVDADLQSSQSIENPAALTREEENALRYVCGYILRKVGTTLNGSDKEEMEECLRGLFGDEMDEAKGTEEWTNAIDRGGLWHVSDETYKLFYCIEENVRKAFIIKGANSEAKLQLKPDDILDDEAVIFHWSQLSTDINDSISKKVLEMIVQLYITVRGFSFASSFIELYKQSKGKLLQKGKGLRKELFTSSCTM